MATTTLLTLVAVALAGAAVAGAHVVRREGRLGLRNVAAAAVAMAAGSVVALPVVRRVVDGPALYTTAHLMYLVVVLAVPLVGVGLAVLAGRRGARRAVWVVAVALLVPGAVGVYATHVEPFWLRVDRVTVPIDPDRAGDDEVRIAVLADIQTSAVGDHERRAVAEVMAAAPDVILVPGDLFQGEMATADLAAMRDLVGRLAAPGGVWFVRGDSDGHAGGNASRILDGLDVEVLVDEVVTVTVGDRTLRIGGTVLRYATAPSERVRRALLMTPDDGAITILLGHRPDNVLMLPPSSRVDLTVGGHTHGGQVVVPGLGPVQTMSDVPRRVARGGLHDVDGNLVYVSPGVGMQRGVAPQVRFLSRPSIAVLTLRDA